jgi:hypothetical protein
MPPFANDNVLYHSLLELARGRFIGAELCTSGRRYSRSGLLRHLPLNLILVAVQGHPSRKGLFPDEVGERENRGLWRPKPYPKSLAMLAACSPQSTLGEARGIRARPTPRFRRGQAESSTADQHWRPRGRRLDRARNERIRAKSPSPASIAIPKRPLSSIVDSYLLRTFARPRLQKVARASSKESFV